MAPLTDRQKQILGLAVGSPEMLSYCCSLLKEHGIDWEPGRFTGVQDEKLASAFAGCNTAEELHALLVPRQPRAIANQRRRMMQLRDLQAAEEAWKTPFVLSVAVMDYLEGKLRQYANEWNPAKWYAPLCALLQSSGWGKSRLICQLWQRNIFVSYISCMGKVQTGFPKRTPELADIIQSGSESATVALLLATMSTLQESGLSCEDWLKRQEEGNVYPEIHRQYLALKERVDKVAPTPPSGHEISEAELANYYSRCETVYGELYREQLEKFTEGSLLLVCVDEAGELEGLAFGALRRALTYIPATKKFFSLVLGTDWKVADLAAAYDEDPGARVRLLSKTNQLFAPICLIGVSDALVNTDTGRGRTRQQQVVRYGRPLWAAYYDALTEYDKVGAVISLAKKKLLGGEVKFEKGWVTREIAVAVFAVLIGLDVVAWGTLPQELAARHMRTILKIAPDRRRVYTAAVAEPALAAAAAELLHMDQDAYLNDFLTRLIEVCVDGLVLEGVRGEMVARIILILAMHELTKDDNYIKPVSTRQFFGKLFGEDVVEQLDKNCCNMDDVMFFNCFIPTTLKPSPRKLGEYFDRCAAMVNRRNETVIDFCIPGCSEPKVNPSGSRVPRPRAAKKPRIEQNYPIRAGIYTAFPGQVKTCDTSLPGAAEKLDADDRYGETSSFLFQIGSLENEVEVDGSVVLVRGLGFATFLSGGVLDKLKQLASTQVKIFMDASELEMKVLRGMAPLAY